MQTLATRKSIDEMLPFYGEVFRFLKHQVACAEEAADLTQQTYLRLIRWHRDGHPKVESRRGILYTIARNLLIDRSRRFKRDSGEATEASDIEVSNEPVNPITPARVVEAREEFHVVEQAISTLPERCREVFILNRFGHLSYAEIADRLEISRSTVEKHMIKAISVCREALR